LEQILGVNPKTLANASLKDVMDCIRSAGLYRNKALRIIEVSRIILEKYGCTLSAILEKNLNQARNELMELPGVGSKTADVFLLF
jgi:endonuclease III